MKRRMDRDAWGWVGHQGKCAADKKRFNGWLNKLNLYLHGSFHLCSDYWGARKIKDIGKEGRDLYNKASTAVLAVSGYGGQGQGDIGKVHLPFSAQ